MEKKKKFEDKMKELEEIIDKLESGEQDLDDSINEYTKAMKLIKECDEEIKNYEDHISKIVLENGQEEDFSMEEDQN